jgi:hypothetical protein
MESCGSLIDEEKGLDPLKRRETRLSIARIWADRYISWIDRDNVLPGQPKENEAVLLMRVLEELSTSDTRATIVLTDKADGLNQEQVLVTIRPELEDESSGVLGFIVPNGQVPMCKPPIAHFFSSENEAGNSFPISVSTFNEIRKLSDSGDMYLYIDNGMPEEYGPGSMANTENLAAA